MEERLDVLAGSPPNSGFLGVKGFLFQEGRDSVAEAAFRKIAQLTGALMRPLIYRAGALSRCCRPRPLMPREPPGARLKRARGAAVAADHLLSQMRQTAIRNDYYLLGGILLFFLVLRALRHSRRRTPPRWRLVTGAGGRRGTSRGGGVVIAGRFDMAIGLGGLDLLLGMRNGSLMRMFKSFSSPRKQNVSCVRSAMIEMELDHDSGKMRGTVLAGPDEGIIDSMTRPQCEASMTFVAGRSRGREADGSYLGPPLPDACCSAKPGQLWASKRRAAPARCPRMRRMKFGTSEGRVGGGTLFGRTVR